jgi:GT2 family glycosyltransferase
MPLRSLRCDVSGPTLSVVVKTYDWPEALDVVLRSLSEEEDADFEIVVADDGSGPRTADVVESWRGRFRRIVRAWQADRGFRLARAQNLAALEAEGDFLVFLDGDAVPRRGFLQAVRRAALPGWFLTTKRVNLSQRLTGRVLEDGMPLWRWSALRWLVTEPRSLVSAPRPREPNRPGMLVPIRDRRRPWRSRQPEFAPPYDLYGCLMGIWREDFERVNGFDARFAGWGEEDVDMAVRLRRAGVRCGWPGPRATLLHLWHLDRVRTANMPLLRETQRGDRSEAVEGLRELRAELARERVEA